jgi:hypothetical protein
MNKPGLISAIDALTTATTSALSARLSLSSSPFIDFATTARPSSLSITPRKRVVCACWGGGCCASAAVSAALAAAAPISAAAIVNRVGLISGLKRDQKRQRHTP